MRKIRSIAKQFSLFRYIYLIYNRYIDRLNNYLNNEKYETKRSVIINIASLYKLNDVFVETGTFLGETVEKMKDKFNRVISIELSKELADGASNRFINDRNVSIICGDSSLILVDLIAKFKAPCLFWLDGHYSSEFYIGDKYIKTAMGESVTPIIKELNILLSHHIKKHVILIDDARLFRGKGGYPSIRDVKNLIKNSGYYYAGKKNDIIRIFPT
jgi:hypothetical protein